jgi:hypothetical protein
MVLLLLRSIERWNGQRELSKPMQALFMLAFAIALCVDVPVALALLPFAIIYGALEWRIARAIGLDKRGYFGGHFVRGTWLYEEVCNQTVRSLRLELANTEPGHWEMFFPTDEQWRARVPEWAKDRRRKIAVRIAGRLKAKDFQSPADLGAINA